MKQKVKRGLIILLGLSIQMSMYNYVNAYGSTRNVQADYPENVNINIKIISATPKKIKIKFINKGDGIAHYGASFTLYKYKKGKWKKIDIVSKTPKTLRPIEVNSSRTEKIICKKIFGKKLSKGKYKLKWVQSKKFTIK